MASADIRLFVFDMAGTTVRAADQVPVAFTNTLAAHGIHITPEQLSSVRGASKRQAIRNFISDGGDRERRAEEIYADFQRELTRLYQSSGPADAVSAIPGAAELFAWLRGRGIRVALNTGFDRSVTSLLLDKMGWNGAVDAVVCGDDVANGRPAPDMILRAMEKAHVADPQQVAVVGDTVLDLQAAHAAGVKWNIGVLTGAHSRELLAKHPHTHLLESVADIQSLFRE